MRELSNWNCYIRCMCLLPALMFGSDVLADDSLGKKFLSCVVSIDFTPPTARGVGVLLRWKQKAYLVTAETIVDFSNEVTQLSRRTNEGLVLSKKIAELAVSPKIDWHRMSTLHVCAAEIKAEEFGFALGDLFDLAAIEGIVEKKSSNESLIFYGFPLPRIELFPAMSIPVSVVSDLLEYRLNGVDYKGMLVYPSVGKCAGGLVVSKNEGSTRIRGLIVREIAFKDRIAGFMLLIDIHDIAAGISKLQ